MPWSTAAEAPTVMRVRTILTMLLAVQLVLVAALIGLAIAMQQTQLEAEAAEVRRFTSYQLADELRQSSDDLTRFARTFVATGDERYEQYFRRILAIRGGEAPRPEGYEGIYWDLLAAGLGKDWPEGPPTSLRSRMLDAGFTNEEFDKLSVAQNRSDDACAARRCRDERRQGPLPRSQRRVYA